MFSKAPPPPQNPEESDELIESDVDSEIEDAEHIKVKDDTRRQTFIKREVRPKFIKNTAIQDASHVKQETVTDEHDILAAPHMIMKAAVYHMKVAPITFPKVSSYVPSFYMFFFALNDAHLIVHDNTYLKYLSPNYISVASTLYYAFIAIIQVLRAKTAAGIITRQESQALRRFEREFPFESLPIMSPLIMFFQNLGAIKLSDPMYSWICPTIPEVLGTNANENGIFSRSQDICLPNVPALIRFLFEIGTAATPADVTLPDGRLAPASAVAANANFFGINLAPGQQNTPANQRLIYSAGWLTPPEISTSVTQAMLRRVSRWSLPTLTSANDLRSIGQFLQTDGNMEWFKNLINICVEEAKFFKGSTNLAAVSPTSGLSSLIEIKSANRERPEVIDDIYPFSTRNFNSDVWKFEMTTTRGDTSNDEIRIGATTQFLVRDFGALVPPNHQIPAPDVDGPYFGNPADARQANQQESDQTRSPKLSFEQIIREQLYDHTGGQTGRL
jgi:hypothetical protein